MLEPFETATSAQVSQVFDPMPVSTVQVADRGWKQVPEEKLRPF